MSVNTATQATSLSVVGRKKTAKAVAKIQQGSGIITVNKKPLDLFGVPSLVSKLYDPINLLGKEVFSGLDIEIKVSGGGSISQMYAVRMAISRAIVTYYERFVDEASKRELKTVLLNYDKSLLVVDTRKALPKKAGGKGARGRFRMSFR